jgi:single-strand DNA-binding protein
LLGNLGRDPEVREIPSGKVVSFSLATTEHWTDREGEKQEQTDWHRVVAYNGVGEVAERFLRKGSRVYVEGQLQTRKWTDAEGTERLITVVVLGRAHSELVLLDPKSQ